MGNFYFIQAQENIFESMVLIELQMFGYFTLIIIRYRAVMWDILS